MEFVPLEVKVWGDYALFTQPEMKVERMSYPCMTPSAARGILESIFWKPEIWWEIREIHVNRPIKYQSIMRNEVQKAIPVTSIGKGLPDFYADDYRTQRHSLILRDVSYKIVADIRLKEHCTDDIAKYRDIFRRRVSKGQCFQRPYLGCREFAAYFSEPSEEDQPLDFDHDIGNMLFDLKYAIDSDTGIHIPIFFHAKIEKGILHVPTDLYHMVR